MMLDQSALHTHAIRRPRLLVVDDEPMMTRMLERVLTGRGFDVSTAANGTEAMARLTAAPFDLVLSDMVMPQCDGLCLLEAMRTAGICVPVVILTGYADATDLSLVARGAAAVLGKPASVDVICTTLATVLPPLTAP